MGDTSTRRADAAQRLDQKVSYRRPSAMVHECMVHGPDSRWQMYGGQTSTCTPLLASRPHHNINVPLVGTMYDTMTMAASDYTTTSRSRSTTVTNPPSIHQAPKALSPHSHTVTHNHLLHHSLIDLHTKLSPSPRCGEQGRM